MKKLNNPTENFVSRRINQRRVRRWVALLSALVLFLTVNTLKLEADTLERIATCGIEQHVHDESCYDASGALICGLAEHAHTDACFQQRPQRHDLTRVDGFMPLNAKVTLATPMPKLTSNSADGQDAVQAEADYYSDIPTEVGSGIEPPVDEIETELAGEDAAPAVEDAVPLEIVHEDQAEETVQQPEYVINGSTVLLSDILSVLGMKASGIQTVGELEGESAELSLLREEKSLRVSVTPVLSREQQWMLGMWLRDGISGIGTVTFCDPATGTYGALGHSVSDEKSGQSLPMSRGSITEAEIVDVVRGTAGAPGELNGCSDVGRVLGSVEKNTDHGIYGHLTAPLGGRLVETGTIELGPATILSTVSGREAREYRAEVSRLYKDGDGLHAMIVITDAELRDRTGGIVQGMSGSPVLQNGRLVAAVTHVSVTT